LWGDPYNKKLFSRGLELWCTTMTYWHNHSRYEPVVRHLSVATSTNSLSLSLPPSLSLSGASSSDIPLQAASSSSIYAEAEGLRHLASQAVRLQLVKTKLSGFTKWKPNKAKAGQVGKGIQHLGNLGTPKQGETPTSTSERPKPEGSTPTERIIRLLKNSMGSRVPDTHEEVLTSIKISSRKTIMKTGLQRMNSHHPQSIVLGVPWGSKKRTATPEVLHAGGRSTRVSFC
jgi:hypothetical protein